MKHIHVNALLSHNLIVITGEVSRPIEPPEPQERMKETTADSSQMSESDFMVNFLTTHKPPQEAKDYFHSVPWLDKYLSSPVYKLIPTFSRHLKASGEDYFFSRTLNTPTTIPHFLTLQLKDFKTPEPVTGNVQPQTAPQSRTPAVAPEHPDAVAMISLGNPGVDGHPNVIHGGVTCALLDETMGLLIMLHDNNVRGPGPRDALFTANLNVSYRAPIATPANYLIKLWLVKRQGRKWFSKGQITDHDGKVYAEADGLWVVATRAKL